MGTRCSRLLRKERVVVLGKFDCWIEQAGSPVTPREGPPQGTCVPGKMATRQDVTLQY